VLLGLIGLLGLTVLVGLGVTDLSGLLIRITESKAIAGFIALIGVIMLAYLWVHRLNQVHWVNSARNF
jgi:hypothetical protein